MVIGGPTGSGESTITNEIIRRYPHRITRLVTATTRSPREGERDGVDYYFFTPEQFAEKEANGEIVESTLVRGDTKYGSYAPELKKKLEEGFIVVVNVENRGVRFYKERYGALAIFVMPGSIEEIASRLKKRNPDMGKEEFEKRIKNAQEEIAEGLPLYDYEVKNTDGNLESAINEILSILEKEGYSIEVDAQ